MKFVRLLKSRPNFSKRDKGIALFSVLIALSLASIVIFTFLTLATSEQRASHTYSQGLQAQRLGEQAVNLVIAQIREATTVGTKIAWASQPGAIRQWNEAGEKEYAYKLYSNEEMKTKDWSAFEKDFKKMEGWSSKPHHYVDLNEPVIRGKKAHYPIIHPSASTLPKWPQPLGDDDCGVEGFSFNKLKGRVLSDPGPIGRKAATLSKSSDGHVAMPVQWIYQLADGTMGVLDESPSGGGRTYEFKQISGAGKASRKNPIVARFAFWADDETSKLNINTHAGGLAWDFPRAGGVLDYHLGRHQPAHHEWQRYPGHPASTHLIPALAPGVIDIVNDRAALELLYKIVPRVVGGGSESGTRQIDLRLPREANGLIPDKEPLFPSIDDVAMRSDRSPQVFPDSTGKPIPREQVADHLERTKFFLTANSRAPEVNLFNQPRVAIWPIYNAAYKSPEYFSHLTALDRLIHYCSSMGKVEDPESPYPRHDYVFKRENADSPTHDYEGIPRNQEVYAYLKQILERRIPGYGGSFATKYHSGEYQQILTEIFDYIRSTNLHDDSLFKNFSNAFTKENVSTNPTFTNPRRAESLDAVHRGHGQVVPIKIDETRGFGRFYTLSRVMFHVISCAEPGDIPMPRNFGVSSEEHSGLSVPSSNPGTYPGNSSQALYGNFPPLPAAVRPPLDPRFPPPDYLAIEPEWLRELREQPNLTLYRAAMDEGHWNWQLAYLDPVYRNNVLNDPSMHKFNRASLSLAAFTRGDTRLSNNEQLVQAIIYFDLFSPSFGTTRINPDFEIEISAPGDGLYFDSINPSPSPDDGRFLGFILGERKWVYAPQRMSASPGGPIPFVNQLMAPSGFCSAVRSAAVRASGANLSSNQRFTRVSKEKFYHFGIQGSATRLTPLDRGYNLIHTVSGLNEDTAQAYKYDLVTIPFKIGGASVIVNSATGRPHRFVPGKVKLNEGELKFTFYHGGKHVEESQPNQGLEESGAAGGEIVQEIGIKVPEFSFSGRSNGLYPTMLDFEQRSLYHRFLGGYVEDDNTLRRDTFSVLEANNLGMDPGNPHVLVGQNGSLQEGTKASYEHSSDEFTLPVAVGRLAQRAVTRGSLEGTLTSVFLPNDLIQSIEVEHGDYRIVAGRANIEPDGEIFVPHRLYNQRPMAHSATVGLTPYMGGSVDSKYQIISKLTGIPEFKGRLSLPFGGNKTGEMVQLYGDFDNGAGSTMMGPYVNKPDEGNRHFLSAKLLKSQSDLWSYQSLVGRQDYFIIDESDTSNPSYFSPNRYLPGPGMFGSLSTGVRRNEPWRTLLFRPELSKGVEPGFRRHPGRENPPDHLFMDLFWMPIVEPYAISEPLSTGGKVNLNFDIVPFLHVQRNTALRGVFRSEMMLCVPNQWHWAYKLPYTGNGPLDLKRLRTVIRDDDTLNEFIRRFDNGRELFKSASAICEMHLIPEEVPSRLARKNRGSVGSYTPKVGQMESGQYWADHALVGDDSRERPYAHIQNRITTKSNTFLVHYRAQVLKQARRFRSEEYAQWHPELDSVQAEYRGSALVERYLNPDDEMIPDFVTRPEESLDAYYRFRVANPRRFAP